MSSAALKLVTEVVEELAVELGYPNLRGATAATPLYGSEGGIDSLTLVRLIADLERAAEDQWGKQIVLASERAMSRRNSPFRTIGTLSEFVQEQLESGIA